MRIRADLLAFEADSQKTYFTEYYCDEADLGPFAKSGRGVSMRGMEGRRHSAWASVAIILLASAAAVAAYRHFTIPPIQAGPDVMPAASEAPPTREPQLRAPEATLREAPRTVLVAPPVGEAERFRLERDGRSRPPVRMPSHFEPRAEHERKKAELAAERQRISITMYSTAWCASCRNARAWLVSKGYRFTEHDIDTNAAAKHDFDRLNPKGSVPTIVVGSEILVGFSSAAIERALTKRAARRVAW